MTRNRESGAVLMVVWLVFVGVVFFGCGKEEPPVQWKRSKELPAYFPPDMPIYPNAELNTVVSGDGSVIVWRTSDPLPAVREYYTKELKAKGWRVTTYPGIAASWMGDDGVTVIGTRLGEQIVLALGERGDKTAIITTVSP